MRLALRDASFIFKHDRIKTETLANASKKLMLRREKLRTQPFPSRLSRLSVIWKDAGQPMLPRSIGEPGGPNFSASRAFAA